LNYAKREIKIPDHGINFNNQEIKFSIITGGKCLTGDQFIDDQKVVDSLSEKYNADVIEMEAFAIGSVAREFNILHKCIFIKAISD
jgi:nucleoside phosphorylase